MDLTYSDILRILPHRYPFLLIDKVLDVVPGEEATGVKNVTLNEEVFNGHFPHDPIFPGVLIVEAMAQTSAVVALSGQCDARPSIYFMTIDGVKFRKPVRPGDTLSLKVQKIHTRGAVWRFSGEAYVQDAIVSEAQFMAMVTDKNATLANGGACN
ncbi:MAG: 3-hydroxyacyl-ACP dehydratase FabZ [Holosporales bacterium]|jgi:3-hydroxyacyl-[acyl-carrier-protein] dehydratase|nr:3-hydroxyacyl-ACP dehydratase FabZ [Holosporales bacterium]